MADKEIQDILEQELQRISQIRMQTNSGGVPGLNDICPVCHNSGWEIITDQDGYEVYRECRCGIRQRQIMQDRLRFANIPDYFKDMRLETFSLSVYTPETRNMVAGVLKAVRYWLDNLGDMQDKGTGLYFFSETKGSGKTRLAASIANELIHTKHMQVRFSTSLQILQEIKNTWDRQNNEGYTENKLLEDLTRTQILIIDDFGTECQDKQWINDRFYQIVNGRYVDKRITLFTSNASIDNLQYDKRITNRIKERAFQIPFPEESVRDVIAQRNMQEMMDVIKV